MKRVIAVLRRAGYEVLSTVVRLRKHTCSACGHTEWPRHRMRDGTFSSGLGTTPGVPDLLVRGADWPRGIWLAPEAKGTKAPQLSKKQKQLFEAGAILIVKSEADALLAVREAEETLQAVNRRS